MRWWATAHIPGGSAALMPRSPRRLTAVKKTRSVSAKKNSTTSLYQSLGKGKVKFGEDETVDTYSSQVKVKTKSSAVKRLCAVCEGERHSQKDPQHAGGARAAAATHQPRGATGVLSYNASCNGKHCELNCHDYYSLDACACAHLTTTVVTHSHSS